MIKVETALSRDIALVGYSEKLDELCKRILSNKIILSWIMKNCMKEYEDCSISDIAKNYIEGIPQIAKLVVHRDERYSGGEETIERITGLNTEDSTVTEGKVTYDIRFIAIIPESEEPVHLIINIEAQDNFYPGYPILKRGIYHCSRMISSQYGTEFINSKYENIKKVYSVWICTNPPQYRKNTITKYSMSEINIVGDVQEKTENFDLLTVIMICLGGSHYNNYSGILKLLDVLLSTEISVNEKKQILKDEFHIEMTIKLEQEVRDMCDFSAGVEKRGEIKTTLNSIKRIMKNLQLNIEQAMDILELSEQERMQYREMIK